ncbi:MAG TPA: hypothetical protein DCY27_04995 [Desulfobacterales bacterium]|nr:hypothetical protein [Desulfobacterales bacterium]
MNYLAIIEAAGNNYSAYLPDVPGCIASGDTPEETLKLLAEALKLHLKGLRAEGYSLPQPKARAGYISCNTSAIT